MPKPKLKEKRWSKETEKQIYLQWKKDKVYAFQPELAKKVYSIDTPPPYVNTPVHIGQATTYVLMDMFARFKRMTGFNVLFPLGLDRNGLPIELAAEKKFNVKLTEMSREKFIDLCQQLLEESSLSSMESFLRLGIGFNSWDIGTGLGEIYLTDSPDYRALTQETFIDLWKKGLIYEDTRINNWCPGCQTTIADAEIEYKELPSAYNDMKFKVKETGEDIIVATTRPELIATCAMVIFHPNDERYQQLDGKTAVTPLYDKEVPIKAHPLAEMDKGTGLAMMCSAGDLSDIRFFREMKLKPVIAINADGTMNKHAGFLKGLKVAEARERVIEELRTKKLLIKQKKTMHRTPICERSSDPVEFIAMPEFYLKQLPYKEKMEQLGHQLQFFAPESRQIYLNWVNSVTIDWPISRSRYYATEIPLWYCKKCREPILPPKGKYYQPWKEPCPVKKCPKCKGAEFEGETRVFDTWFDSSNTPLYILKYSRDDKFFNKSFPCTLRPQGKEIIRTWLYYTMLKGLLLTDKLVFQDTWINYHIVDEKGYKMSKRLGNVINPEDALDKFGAEPFRLWSAVEGNLEKTDFRCSFERIEGAGKTITKFWNLARFISQFNAPKKQPKLTALDNWIMAELNELISFARKGFEKYDFHNPTAKLKHFIWETFSSHYIELAKNRAYNQDNKYSKEEQNAALYTMHYCLNTLLKLLAPVIPLITYHIYKELNERDVHFEEFPEPMKKVKSEIKTEELLELNSAIWKAKKDKGLSLRDVIKEAVLPENLKSVEKDLAAAHGLTKHSFGKKLELKF
jgi:valyl-tRNA synthetase